MALMAIIGELGSGKCFSKDTLVGILNNEKFKLLSIEEVFLRRNEFEKVSVFSMGKNSVEKSESMFVYKEPASDVIEITTRCKRKLVLSKSHKLPVFRNGIKWIKAEEIKKGDLLVVPSRLPLEDSEMEWGDISYVIGLYVAEGHNGLVCNSDDKIIKKVCEITGKEVIKVDKRRKRPVKYVNVSKFIPQSLRIVRSREKFIPHHFFNNKKDAIKFIAGYFDGDGYYVKGDNRIIFSSTSKRLLSELSYLLLGFGIPATFRRHGSKNIWELIVSGIYSLKLFFLIRDHSIKIKKYEIREKIPYSDKYGIPGEIHNLLVEAFSLLSPNRKGRKYKFGEEYFSSDYRYVRIRKKVNYKLVHQEIFRRDFETVKEILEKQKLELEKFKKIDSLHPETIIKVLDSLPFPVGGYYKFFKEKKVEKIIEEYENRIKKAEKILKQIECFAYWFMVDEIRKVERKKYDDWLYDLVVPKNQNLIGGNLPTFLHNTLSLTYLAWRNWYYKKKKIYANYTLFGIPYVRIRKVSDLEKIRDGFLAYDEMFVDLEATASRSVKNRIIFNILRKSRKRNYSLVFTAQVLNTVDARIRKILDFIAYPILNPRKTICKLLIFNGPKPTVLLRTVYFRTAPIFRMYKTEEEVSELLDDVTAEIRKRK